MTVPPGPDHFAIKELRAEDVACPNVDVMVTGNFGLRIMDVVVGARRTAAALCSSG